MSGRNSFVLAALLLFLTVGLSCRKRPQTYGMCGHYGHFNDPVQAGPRPIIGPVRDTLPPREGTIRCEVIFYKDSGKYDSTLLRRYLRKNTDSICRKLEREVQYPVMALDAGRSGNVYVRLLYNKTYRKADSVEIARGLPGAPYCDKEAIRAISLHRSLFDSLFTKKPPGLKETVVRTQFIIR